MLPAHATQLQRAPHMPAGNGEEMKRKFNSLAMRFRKSGGAEPTQDPMQYRSLLVDGGDDDDDDDDEGATEVVLRADAPVTRHVGRGGARVSQV